MPKASSVGETGVPREVYRRAFDAVGVGLCLLDPGGRVLDANDAWLASTGFQREAAVGRDLWQLFPDTPPELRRLHDEVRAGKPVNVPAHRQILAGRTVWYEGRLVPVQLDDGVGILITARDVTQRLEAELALREMETRQAFLLGLSDALRPVSDPVEVQAVATRMLGEHLGASRVFYGAIADGGETCLVERDFHAGVASVAGRHRVADLGPSLTGAMAEGRTLALSDVPADRSLTDAEHATHRALEIGAVMGVPLLKGGRWVALLGAHHRTPHRWTPQELGLVEETAERTWAAVERARAEAALRDSEERMRLAMEAAAMYSWEVDLATGTARTSENFGAVVGLEARTLPQDARARIQHMFRPEDAARLGAALERTMRGEGDLHLELTSPSPDADRPAWLEIHGTRVGGAGGAAGRVVGVGQNITRRKQAEERLRASEARHGFLLRLSDALRPLADPTAIQREAARVLGEHLGAMRVHYAEVTEDGEYALVTVEHRVPGATSVVGRHHFDSYGPAVMKEFRAGRTLVVDSVRDDPRLSAEERARTAALGIGAYVILPLVKSGRAVAVLVAHRAAPCAWSPGELELVEETAERTWAAVERARAEAALRESDQRKTEFLAVLSHELRNPLAPIRNSIYLLGRAEPGSEQARRAREVLHRQAEHLTRLVDDLLDITRISRGKIDIKRARLDLRDVVRRSTDDLRSLFEESGVELRVEHAAGPVWVEGDATRLSQVLGNLLQNAVKFTPARGAVTVALAAAEGRATLAVRDTGAGIEPGEVERMFEPFTQAEHTLARTEGGLGLGLALVKGLVELHGGSVRASSAGIGRGAEFVITLPVAAEAERGASGPAAAAGGARARRVLIVEDNVDAGRTLADLLELAGHQVSVARDARSGLDMAREVRPEVVICDIGLPDMDGYAFARAARRDDVLRGSRLVALTGYAQPEDRQRALDAGFDAHLPKPPPIEELEALLAGA